MIGPDPPDPPDPRDPPGPVAARAAPPWLDYRRPAVRDLAWLVLDGALRLPPGSGALATVRLDRAEREEFVQLLQDWDQDPQDGWLGPVDPGLRLGLYSERLVGAWLRQSRRIRLVAMNWPLRVNRVTLGEADFLVQRHGSEGGGLQLWELACKFYLRVPGRGWIGPELNDSLAAKLARVRGRQLQLIHHPGFRSAWGSNWSAQAWMAGWLLDCAASLADPPPADRSAAGLSCADASPADAGPGQARQALPVAAVWAETGALSLPAAESHARALGIAQWWLLPKRRWLRPIFADEPVAQRFSDLAEAAAYLAAPLAPRRRAGDLPRPLMLAGIRWLQPASQAAVAAEAMRVMLLPRGWLQRAAALPARTGQRDCGAGACGPIGTPGTAGALDSIVND